MGALGGYLAGRYMGTTPRAASSRAQEERDRDRARVRERERERDLEYDLDRDLDFRLRRRSGERDRLGGGDADRRRGLRDLSFRRRSRLVSLSFPFRLSCRSCWSMLRDLERALSRSVIVVVVDERVAVLTSVGDNVARERNVASALLPS